MSGSIGSFDIIAPFPDPSLVYADDDDKASRFSVKLAQYENDSCQTSKAINFDNNYPKAVVDLTEI